MTITKKKSQMFKLHQAMLRLFIHEGVITAHRQATPIQHPGSRWAAICVKPKQSLPVLCEVIQKSKRQDKNK